LGINSSQLANVGFNTSSPTVIYAGLLNSRFITDTIVRRFDIEAQYHTRLLSVARRNFEQHTAVDCSGMNGLIRVAITDPDPSRAAAMANTYVDLFRNLLYSLETKRARERSLIFDGQLKDARKRLAIAEHKLLQTEQKTGWIAGSDQTRALINSAAKLHAQILTEDARMQSLRAFATPQNPEILDAQIRLRALNYQLSKLIASPTRSDKGLTIPQKQIPQASMQYERDLNDVEYFQTMVDFQAQQAELAKVDEAQHAAVLVVDPASPPQRPSSPEPALLVPGAFLTGILTGMFWALAAYGLDLLRAVPSTRVKLAYLLHLCGLGRPWARV
jgi:uncharacterized protein involved in exopolysaccharide biosynthesis